MAYFTEQNTEGFTEADLEMLNAAHSALVAKHGSDEGIAQTIGDMLNNAWFEGVTEEYLIAAVDGRL